MQRLRPPDAPPPPEVGKHEQKRKGPGAVEEEKPEARQDHQEGLPAHRLHVSFPGGEIFAVLLIHPVSQHAVRWLKWLQG